MGIGLIPAKLPYSLIEDVEKFAQKTRVFLTFVMLVVMIVVVTMAIIIVSFVAMAVIAMAVIAMAVIAMTTVVLALITPIIVPTVASLMGFLRPVIPGISGVGLGGRRRGGLEVLRRHHIL